MKKKKSCPMSGTLCCFSQNVRYLVITCFEELFKLIPDTFKIFFHKPFKWYSVHNFKKDVDAPMQSGYNGKFTEWKKLSFELCLKIITIRCIWFKKGAK